MRKFPRPDALSSYNVLHGFTPRVMKFNVGECTPAHPLFCFPVCLQLDSQLMPLTDGGGGKTEVESRQEVEPLTVQSIGNSLKRSPPAALENKSSHTLEDSPIWLVFCRLVMAILGYHSSQQRMHVSTQSSLLCTCRCTSPFCAHTFFLIPSTTGSEGDHSLAFAVLP